MPFSFLLGYLGFSTGRGTDEALRRSIASRRAFFFISLAGVCVACLIAIAVLFSSAFLYFPNLLFLRSYLFLLFLKLLSSVMFFTLSFAMCERFCIKRARANVCACICVRVRARVFVGALARVCMRECAHLRGCVCVYLFLCSRALGEKISALRVPPAET